MCLHLCACIVLASVAAPGEVYESFDSDPGWDGLNNLPAVETLREVRQDFGYSATTHSGDTPGEIGGVIQPDGEPAYYAKPLPPLGFSKSFKASGLIFVTKGPGNTFLGFFNHGTINEWRTPNSLGFRINQRGDTFHVHTEYATSKWRASAGVIGRVDVEADRVYPTENPGGTRYSFSIDYTPDEERGGGLIRARFDDVVSDCVVSAEHLKDGASFDRFGILNIVKSVDSAGELWLRDVEINGVPEDLSKDPEWEGLNNRRHYLSAEVRPRFDFGYRDTQFAGGDGAGEIGGLFFRGDCRYADKLGYYGGNTGPLSLAMPLKMSGKLALHKGVSDSTTLFGFFNAEASVSVSDSQSQATPKNFLGIGIEGPSSEGFYVYPVCRGSGGDAANGGYSGAPRIYPNGQSHAWSFTYDPANGEIELLFDEEAMTWQLPKEIENTGASFDHIGFVTPWIDGNAQRVYVDDLRYTFYVADSAAKQ